MLYDDSWAAPSHVCACADRNSPASILLQLEVYSMAWHPPLIDSAVCRSMNEWIIYTLLRNTGCISLLSRQGGSIGMGPRQQATILRYRAVVSRDHDRDRGCIFRAVIRFVLCWTVCVVYLLSELLLPYIYIAVSPVHPTPSDHPHVFNPSIHSSATSVFP
jgi:hypothetical protein